MQFPQTAVAASGTHMEPESPGRLVGRACIDTSKLTATPAPLMGSCTNLWESLEKAALPARMLRKRKHQEAVRRLRAGSLRCISVFDGLAIGQ